MMSFGYVIKKEFLVVLIMMLPLNKCGTVMVRTSQRLRTKMFYKIHFSATLRFELLLLTTNII